MIRKIIFIVLCMSALLHAKPNPSLFAQLGDPLYESVAPFGTLGDIPELKEAVAQYEADAKKVMACGEEAEAKNDGALKQKYLNELRSLEKRYASLLHLLHSRIDAAVAKDDYALLERLLRYEFANLLHPRALSEKTLEYYKQKNSKTKIPFLEKKIATARITVEKEFFATPEKATFDPAKKEKKSSKPVSMRIENQGDAIAVFVENNNPYGITLSVDGMYENMRDENPPKEIALPAGGSVLYTKLYPKTQGKYGYKYRYSWIIGRKDAVHDEDFLYRLPFARGTSQFVSQGYNGSFSHFGHSQYAIDFAMDVGTKIYAARGGVVVKTKSDSNTVGATKEFAKFGNFVTIEHEDGTLATYYHLKQYGVVVEVGAKVAQGDFLGYSGNTGYSNGPHLHFAVFKAKDAATTESLPVRFKSEEGIIGEPIRGKSYTAR
jgi:murein DD-endopeptidase MepM/ murein hydrolase activator NlpD